MLGFRTGIALERHCGPPSEPQLRDDPTRSCHQNCDLLSVTASFMR